VKTEDDVRTPSRPPRDNLVRAMPLGSIEVRHSADDGPPTMFGHFAVFNEWTRVESWFEGEFMERIAPGAFAKTFAENRAAMRVTFNHGQDPELGDKVLGNITELKEDDTGAYYEVPLFRSVPALLREGLDEGAYGASFRFRVMKEEFEDEPKPSDHNPIALPERTIREAHVMEFGPVTFPAYQSASAGIRSLTDEFLLERLIHGEGLRKLAAFAEEKKTHDIGAEAEPHSSEPLPPPPRRFRSREEFLQWLYRT
jgi:HK97 family phage prohead protease